MNDFGKKKKKKKKQKKNQKKLRNHFKASILKFLFSYFFLAVKFQNECFSSQKPTSPIQNTCQEMILIL